MRPVVFVLSIAMLSAGWSRADEADNVVTDAANGWAPQSAVAAVAPDRLVPAVYRALDALPPRSSRVDSVKVMRVEGLLFDLESRTRKADLDKLLLAAWPFATKDHTRADLLYKFGERRIREAEPIVLSAFNDKSAAKAVRDTAAASLVALDWPKHRAAILPELDADDTFAPLAVELALFHRKELDPTVVAIAARRIEKRAADGQATEAGLLAQLFGRYTGQANGVTKIMRAELSNPNDPGQVADLELRSFRVWWSQNRQRFEPAAKAEIERLKAEQGGAAK
jgi:hypothetical protein